MLSTRSLSADVKARIKRLIRPTIPKDLKRRFKSLSPDGFRDLESSLKRNYFSRQVWGGVEVDVESLLASNEGRSDMSDHLYRRLDLFRATVVPWLADAKPIAGARILEIGCGTGSSTVALAEQGAEVVAVDVDEHSLQVARDRCAAYGLNASFLGVNANQVFKELSGQHFDFVIFFACLEHMTHDERIDAMRGTWKMLSSGDLWCVIETPNRLWYFDHHTSRLPFYSWLPNDLAFDYSRFSPREPFKDSYRQPSADAMLSFLRHGRGVSFHEFDVAMKPAPELDVVSSRRIWLREKSFLRLWDLAWRVTLDHRFETCLVAAKPEIHRGFYQPFLDLIIRKN